MLLEMLGLVWRCVRMSEEETEKMLKIEDLYATVFGIPELKFFDLSSEELLMKKIEVLTQLKKGKRLR